MKRYQKPKIKIKKIKGTMLFSRNTFLDYETLAAVCFLPKTAILMADGSKKNIETIKLGEKVQSYNLKEDKAVEESVEELYIHPNKKVQYFIINNNLKLTNNHPLWVNNTSWKRADKLKINDYLLDPQGEKIIITNIIKKEGTHTVYNLGLNGPNNNYFSENILVHNRSLCCGQSPLPSTCTGC